MTDQPQDPALTAFSYFMQDKAPSGRRRTTILAAIARERQYQEAKWPDHEHELPTFIMIARAELAEAEIAWCRDETGVHARAEIVQAIAVLVACLEQHRPAEEENRSVRIGPAPAGLDVAPRKDRVPPQ